LLDRADRAARSVDTSPLDSDSDTSNVEDIRDHRRRAAQS
jgi:hypothetical protein